MEGMVERLTTRVERVEDPEWANFQSSREIETTEIGEESVVGWRIEQESAATAGRRLVVEGRMRTDELASEEESAAECETY